MTTTARRITLIQTPTAGSARAWDRSSNCPSRCIAVPSFHTLRHALRSGVTELGLDVERVILDVCATPTDYLELIASLPLEFTGDVVLLREDGGAWINATGRGSGRVLYSLSARDVNFYLEIHGLLQNGRFQVVPEHRLQLAA